ncbi:hypothetical protein VTK73DRAFT_3435 [Phialemonium thermophilum]|uniref:Uncharacterized protein n=1 Tax=Phialemonium thermophilum TaxID=223376 RepID=A0ABR3VIB7_9PEZI
MGATVRHLHRAITEAYACLLLDCSDPSAGCRLPLARVNQRDQAGFSPQVCLGSSIPAEPRLICGQRWPYTRTSERQKGTLHLPKLVSAVLSPACGCLQVLTRRGEAKDCHSPTTQEAEPAGRSHGGRENPSPDAHSFTPPTFATTALWSSSGRTHCSSICTAASVLKYHMRF